MIRKLLGIILLTPAALAAIRPDVSFTGDNDRFDVSAMVNARNNMFRDTPQLEQDDEDDGGASDEDSRRNMQNTDKNLRDVKPLLTRREDIDFAYDPDNLPTIGRAGDDDMVDLEYQENMKKFKMMIPKARRRKMSTDEQKHENQVLMENVVPFVMEIDGFLQAPFPTPLQKLVALYGNKQGKKVTLETDD